MTLEELIKTYQSMGDCSESYESQSKRAQKALYCAILRIERMQKYMICEIGVEHVPFEFGGKA